MEKFKKQEGKRQKAAPWAVVVLEERRFFSTGLAGAVLASWLGYRGYSRSAELSLSRINLLPWPGWCLQLLRMRHQTPARHTEPFPVGGFPLNALFSCPLPG